MAEETKKEEIIEHNSVETTTDISAPAGERTEVIESTTESETEVTEDDKSDA